MIFPAAAPGIRIAVRLVLMSFPCTSPLVWPTSIAITSASDTLFERGGIRHRAACRQRDHRVRAVAACNAFDRHRLVDNPPFAVDARTHPDSAAPRHPPP